MFIQVFMYFLFGNTQFVIHIGVGFLRCSFSEGGQCEGLEIRDERR